MNRAVVVIVFTVVAMAGWSCRHTQTATDPQKPAAESAGTPKRNESKQAKVKDAESKSHASQEAGSTDGSALPLATSPAGLLKPGAAEAIQKALVERGYLSSSEPSGKLDGATEKALRSFQDDHHLPATGMPDDFTVRKLGLEVSQVFKAAPSQ